MLNEPEAVCGQTGLSPFYTSNKPPAGNDPFWNKKPPQDKPAKPHRMKTKVVKKPAKKRTTASSEPNADDDVGNPESEDDVEGSQADDVEGTSHSSSGESSATQLPPLKTVPGAKPRPSKKARLNKPTDDNVAIEPEKTPDPEETDADAMLNDPPPQDHEFFAERVQVDTISHADQPTSPVRTDDKPVSPVKDTDKPPTPVKAADDKEDDVVITGIGHTTPGNPVALSKHTAKGELSAIGKGKWNTDLSSYAHLNAQDIHSGFLNRLYTSRDYEAGLVNLMRERYECYEEKEYQMESKRNEINWRSYFWKETCLMDLDPTSRKKRGAHKCGGRAPLSRGTLVAPLMYLLHPYIPT
ncbi:cell surface glycoprotein 1-like isoform X2 [Triticum urartu]|uniref:cell surface glycoprotein 1-like isoform X2 n=1 Tax=Triticum urartu TaxID=4572 RepID=UPI00204444CE|nr:cell surface glycoprotein 1-like isoform X2 [Triticum urartu]